MSGTVYTPILGFTEPGVGAPSVKNAWGGLLNSDFVMVEQAITGDNGFGGGTGGINIAGLSTYSLTTTNGVPNQARQLLYPFVGALTTACTVTIASTVKFGWAMNATTGGNDVLLTSGSGSQVTLPPDGVMYFFYCDGNGNVTLPTVGFAGQVIDPTSSFQTMNAVVANIGTLNVSGTTTFGTAISASTVNATTVNATSGTFSGAVAVNSLTSTKNVNAATLNVTAANVTGPATVSTLSATSGAIGTMTGTNASLSGTMTASTVAATTVNTTNLNASGAIAGATLTSTGNANVDGLLTTLGQTFFGNSGQFYADPNFEGSQLLNFASTHFLIFTPGIGFELNTGGSMTFSVASGTSFASEVTVGAAVNATAFNVTSDERVKTDIEELAPQAGEDFVKNIRPVRYKKDGVLGTGFVAQDMLRAGYDHVVSEHKKDGLEETVVNGVRSPRDKVLTVAYDDTIAYLTAALKSALARIDALENRAE